MANNTKISVITGIYHPNEHLFRKFLYSCLNQTLEGIQFIFIYDDPEDVESRKIVEEHRQAIEDSKNTFTIIENKQNMGIYATQMIGLKNAIGEYVVFFDNDDFFDLEYLEVMYKYAKEFAREYDGEQRFKLIKGVYKMFKIKKTTTENVK